MEAELLQQVAQEWLGRPLDEAAKTARRLAGLLAELREAERSAAEPAFRFDPVASAGWVPGAPGVSRGLRAEGGPVGGSVSSPDGAIRVMPVREEGGVATDPLDRPAAELARLVQHGQLSAVELTQASLARIDTQEAQVNAFVTRLPERALAQAAAVDAAIRRGEQPGPLAGLPVGLKDLIDLAGVPTTACSPMRAAAVAQSDAVVTARLAAAGAVPLGKTATHEWAYGTTCDSRLHGSTRNPRAMDRSPGGSSGGSAAAVAAGMVVGALGTDTAGSIRIPAACCGVVGFKPTFGRVSRAGILPLSHSLDHAGPIGRSVADVALLFAAIAEGGGLATWGNGGAGQAGSARPDGWLTEPGGAPSASGSLAGLRIGLPTAWLQTPLDPGVERCFQAVLTRLARLGAQLIPVEAPPLALGHFISRILTLAEGATVHAAHLDRLSEYPPDVRARLELGQFILARDYLLAQQLRTNYCQAMAAAMAGVDLLVTPTQPIPAPLLTARSWTYADGSQEAVADALTRFVAPANVTGQPALSLPCGQTPEGLPVGLQLMGHPGGDAPLLGRAALIEAALGG